MLGINVKRLILGIQYDGTPWHGWQTQLSGLTVQDQLELALKKFTQTDIKTSCAGRTDTGVHAIEQVVHFDTIIDRPTASWVRGLNTHLPPSIAVRWVTVACTDFEHEFHARFSARSRVYHYLLYNHPVRSPLWEGKAGWVFRPLDVDRMQEAAQGLIGTHDFTAFRSADCQAKSPVKMMHDIAFVRRGDLIVIKLHANAFLHHMVRNLVGSLIYVGNGSQSVTWLSELLVQKNRHLAAPTFSPHGLYLAKIDYDPKWQLPQAPADAFAGF
ncbi:tRNA pseudouridine(38-40) synthase TruA [Actimicrobium antarcticum]